MSETFEDRFNAAMADFLKRNGINDVAKITGMQQRSEEWRYSEYTYGGTNYTVDIEYEGEHGEYGSFTYEGEFGELIRELT